MTWLQEFARRFAMLMRRTRFDREMDEEMRLHRDLKERELVESGVAPEEAHYAAQRHFGNSLVLREESRDAWKWNWLEHLAQDVSYGLRVLRKAPGFTIVAIAALAVGIGANTAIFSIIDGVLLRPLPYPGADRIAMVYIHFEPQNVEHGTMSVADYLDLKSGTTAFQDLALFSNSGWRFDIASTGALPEQVLGAAVTSALFSTLSAQPLLGRAFNASDDRATATPVVIVSESLWRRRFSSNPAVVGQSMAVQGVQRTIVGVMPAAFHFWPSSEIWLNLRLPPPTRRGPYPYMAMGRLKPGVSFQQAQAQVNGVGERIERQYPKSYSHLTFPVVPLREALVGDARPALLLLFGAVGFVLLIAIVNVANLLLARAAVREREIALRTALGAGRARITMQLLTESSLLALAGGAAGLVLAYSGIQLVRAWNPGDLPRVGEIHLDLRVLVFTFLLSLVTGVLFGLIPALQVSRSDVNASLKESSRSAGGTLLHGRTRALLVISEIALSLVLLVGAGLLLRSFVLLEQVKTGTEAPPDRVLTMEISPATVSYSDTQKFLEFYQRLIPRVQQIPGVKFASITTSLPPDQRWNWDTFQIEGQTWTQEAFPGSTCPDVSPGYFSTLGIPLIKGRDFSAFDTPNSPPVVIISQNLANRYFGGQNPIGKHLKQSGTDLSATNPWMEIIGVVGDVKYLGLNSAPEPVYYQTYTQTLDSRLFLVVRSDIPASSLAPTVRSEIQSFDNTAVISGVRSLDDILADSVAQPRFRTALVGMFAGIALLLAGIGIYGVIAYSVAQRTNEIGIRMALGAQRTHVLRLVIGQGFRLTAVGLAIGVAAAVALTRLLATLLFGITPTDLLTFCAVTVLLCAIALVASYIPARRAMQVDPIVALRYE
jgi:predicted permease